MAMWNRNKKEEDLPQRPTFAPTPAEPAREAIPMATYPTKTAEFGSTRGAAVLGRSLVITGRVTGKEDLVIDGRVDGDIELPENRLTVGASGHVQGGVRAREIVGLCPGHGHPAARARGGIRSARPPESHAATCVAR